MSKSQLELADVIRRFMDPYVEQFGHLMLPSHRRALQDIAACMTEAMGGGRYQCNDCHEDFWSYHGCRNRLLKFLVRRFLLILHGIILHRSWL